jgi:O-methyltransferase
MKKVIKRIFKKCGFDIIRYSQYHADKILDKNFDKSVIDIIKFVRPYTMSSNYNINATCEAVRYLIKNNIEGDIVECGTWKSGQMMAAASMLNYMSVKDREIYLYDTYSGMSKPTEHDIEIRNNVSFELTYKTWGKALKNDVNQWCYASLDEVRKNMESTRYNIEKIQFIKGKVEDTIPNVIPQKVALLRLDTDFYESTKHELIHLFPLLQKGGIIIIDDYGHWLGARKATDEYFKLNNIPIFLNYIDYTSRLGIKI